MNKLRSSGPRTANLPMPRVHCWYKWYSRTESEVADGDQIRVGPGEREMYVETKLKSCYGVTQYKI